MKTTKPHVRRDGPDPRDRRLSPGAQVAPRALAATHGRGGAAPMRVALRALGHLQERDLPHRRARAAGAHADLLQRVGRRHERRARERQVGGQAHFRPGGAAHRARAAAQGHPKRVPRPRPAHGPRARRRRERPRQGGVDGGLRRPELLRGPLLRRALQAARAVAQGHEPVPLHHVPRVQGGRRPGGHHLPRAAHVGAQEGHEPERGARDARPHHGPGAGGAAARHARRLAQPRAHPHARGRRARRADDGLGARPELVRPVPLGGDAHRRRRQPPAQDRGRAPRARVPVHHGHRRHRVAGAHVALQPRRRRGALPLRGRRRAPEPAQRGALHAAL